MTAIEHHLNFNYMLNIKPNSMVKYHQSFLLFRSAKSCYVMSRTCLELSPFDFLVPGFMLMQQTIENLIKALLKEKEMKWPGGSAGHNFIKLLEFGTSKIPLFKDKFLDRPEFCLLLDQLQEGYTAQRYGESGHFIEDHETMMDMYDEMVFILINEFGGQIVQKGEELEHLVAIPLPMSFEKHFKRKIKQPFAFTRIIQLED